MLRSSVVIRLGSILLALVGIMACGSQGDKTPAGQPVVCSPFGAAADNGSRQGVYGDIYQFDSPTLATYGGHVNSLQDNGHRLNVQLFSPDINVPTVYFDQGFPTKGGGTLKGSDRQVLVDYFSLALRGKIVLGATDVEADYQFAVLSDDGAILRVDQGAGLLPLIDSDGTHSNRVACASSSIHLAPGSVLPYHLDYYQGPRYHLALMLLWRKVPTGDLTDLECGIDRANEYFFDPTTLPPTPKSPYNDLLARGWSPVPSANFVLPDDVSNPCIQ